MSHKMNSPSPPAADIRAFCEQTSETPEAAKKFFYSSKYYYENKDLLTLQRALENYENDSGVKEKKAKRAQYEQNLYALFLKYADENSNVLCDDSLVNFLSDMGVDVDDDYLSLGVAWVLKIDTMGEITNLEFAKGFACLDLDTEAKIKKHFEKLPQMISNDFRSFYDYCFTLCKNNKTDRYADVDTALAVWGVQQPHVPKFKTHTHFLSFIEAKRPTLSFDLWQNVLRFAEFIADDYSQYKENDSWNSGIDAYVAWQIEQQDE